jgi:Polysaccharide deacetylase/Secretion system C-terminal sorting domain/PA14 domain
MIQKLPLSGIAYLLFGCTTTYLAAQAPSASFATWKDNRKAAYSIIHDDFGDDTTIGIGQYADTIAHNRGIKLNFGAITSVCDASDWTLARRMIAHGHEAINHSHNHLCAVHLDWCTTAYGVADYPVELDTSTAQIERGTGQRPRFFINPYDLSTDSIILHLKQLGYLGDRTGTQEALNTKNFTDFFRLNYHVFSPTSTLAQVNQAVTDAINTQGYAIRELHGVSDASWGMITVANYRAHLNFVHQQMLAKKIWSGTLSEVVTYKMQRDAFNAMVNVNPASNVIRVDFVQTKTLDETVLKSPVTVNVKLNGWTYKGALSISQNGVNIKDFTVMGDTIAINVYPHHGTILINAALTACPSCIPFSCAPNGKLNAQLWTNLTIRSSNLRDLTTDLRYPNLPTRTDTIVLPSFVRGDLGDKYGEKVRGYIMPPVTGQYVFTVTGDNDVELYLSSNSQTGGKVKIAGFTGTTLPTQYTKYTGQNSAPITLQAGVQYYVEALHIGIKGTTNAFRVLWKLPSSAVRTTVDNDFFSSDDCNPLTVLKANFEKQEDVFVFQGFKYEGKSVLNWMNNGGAQNDYFSIEKLDKTGVFKPLDVVNAESLQGVIRRFEYVDEKPSTGDNYYRVRLIQQNGTEKYSEIAKLNFEDPNDLYLYPNPARQYVTLNLKAWEHLSATVYIYNAFGMVLKQLDLQDISDKTYSLNLDEHWDSGQYFIRVTAIGKKDVVKPLILFAE